MNKLDLGFTFHSLICDCELSHSGERSLQVHYKKKSMLYVKKKKKCQLITRGKYNFPRAVVFYKLAFVKLLCGHDGGEGSPIEEILICPIWLDCFDAHLVC